MGLNLIKRPISSYSGGKFRIADWIISHFPKHRRYIEPFGGMASVLLKKMPCEHEIYNDLNFDVVNLFRVLQDDSQAQRLIHKCVFTPYARDELRLAIESDFTGDPVNKAWAFLVKLGFTFRANDICSLNKFDLRHSPESQRVNGPAISWTNQFKNIWPIIKRLKLAHIENCDAIELIAKFSKTRGIETLVYCDPPYLPQTKKTKSKQYRFEFTESEHIKLAETIKSSEMMFIISGYDSDLYNELYKGWITNIKPVRTETNSLAVEKIWISPNTQMSKDSLF